MRTILLPIIAAVTLVACRVIPAEPVAPALLPTITAPVLGASGSSEIATLPALTATVTPLPPVQETTEPDTREAVTPVPAATVQPIEIPVRTLALGTPLTEADIEISGMAWDGERLVLLPQFPARYADALFGIARSEIDARVSGASDAPLDPQAIPFDDAGLHRTIEGFEGFEAIAFHEESLYVTIEARRSATTMSGYLVAGVVNPDGSLRLDPATLTELPAPVNLENYSDEAITIVDGTLLTFYEANGAVVNPDAAARRFALPDLAPLASLPLTPLEYRLTDATPADAEGTFWVINYLFPGDIPKLRIADDLYRRRFGEGESHARNPAVERLIQLRVTDTGIAPADTPPIYLQLERGTARNWEGIVRYGDDGFLLVTDKFPDTLLGYVAVP